MTNFFKSFCLSGGNFISTWDFQKSFQFHKHTQFVYLSLVLLLSLFFLSLTHTLSLFFLSHIHTLSLFLSYTHKTIFLSLSLSLSIYLSIYLALSLSLSLSLSLYLSVSLFSLKNRYLIFEIALVTQYLQIGLKKLNAK